MASYSRKRPLAREPMDECQIKRRRCDVNSIRFSLRFQNEPTTRAAKRNFQLSPYSESPLPKMSTDEIAKNLCNEIDRLRKQKQLHITEADAVSHKEGMELNDNEFGTQMLCCSDEKPLFTFKQVQLICKDLIKEREYQLQQCYESMLTTKLTQQYDVFVKFTYDQIQRRFEAAPSYLS